MVAGREGFEPPEGSSPSTVFKTAAFNRSAISPYDGYCFVVVVEAAPGFEPGIKALQAHALPLGYAAISQLVRMAGVEPARNKLPRDFKSLVSTNSTTLASFIRSGFSKEVGDRGQILTYAWSGRRDSNSRHQPWQGCTLPLSYARILQCDRNFCTAFVSGVGL